MVILSRILSISPDSDCNEQYNQTKKVKPKGVLFTSLRKVIAIFSLLKLKFRLPWALVISLLCA